MNNFPKKCALLILAVCLSFSVSRADIVNYTGTTVGGPTWNRPLAGNPPTALSGVGTNVPWHAVSFTVNMAGSYAFLSVATVPLNWDNFLFLYSNNFNPATPLVNVLIGNDDFPTIGRSGFNFNLNPGTTYFLVTTGFANSNAGAFQNTIDGPGTIIIGGQAVPEGGAGLVLFALVTAGLLALGRRHCAALVKA
ncbi:hypothetical protein BH20VER1_BH20VER1_05980 [soil metagenome]